MTTRIFIFLFLSACINTFAQVNIGKSRSDINLWVSAHKQETFDKIKEGKTIFIVPGHILEAQELQNAIQQVWTFNEIVFVPETVQEQEQEKFDPYSNLPEEYIATGNMVVRLIDNVYSKHKRGGIMGYQERTVGAYITFLFRAAIYENIKKDKKGQLKFDETTIGEILFTPNIRLRQDIAYSVGGKMKIGSFDKINEKFGEEPGFYNFNLGYIKNYFKELNNHLAASKNFKIEEGIAKIHKLQELSEKTLYVPEWALLKYNAMAASYGKTRTAEALLGKYGYPYEVLDNNEINERILAGEDFYYLMHTQFNQRRIISVIHSLTGEIIYLDEDGGYNIKDSDLKALGKLVGKSKKQLGK